MSKILDKVLEGTVASALLEEFRSANASLARIADALEALAPALRDSDSIGADSLSPVLIDEYEEPEEDESRGTVDPSGGDGGVGGDDVR